MRTTLDLPDNLLKRAKIAAIERGVTLRELMSAALSRELQLAPQPAPRRRLSFPLLHPSGTTRIELPPRAAEISEEEEDFRRHGLSG